MTLSEQDIGPVACRSHRGGEACRPSSNNKNVHIVSDRCMARRLFDQSGIDRERGLVAIKPSGVAYDELTEQDIVVLDLDGNVLTDPARTQRRPSTDTPTHLALYRAFDEIGGIAKSASNVLIPFNESIRRPESSRNVRFV